MCEITSRCRRVLKVNSLRIALAILLVVDALSRERRRQLVEGNLVAAGDLLQRAVQLLVGDRQADPLGVLRLNFLQYQPIEHLLLEHALRGQLDLLFLQPLGDRIHLRVQFALQHQAVVDDGGNAVEQFAVHADVAGLRQGDGRQQRLQRHAPKQNKAILRMGQSRPGLKGPGFGHSGRGLSTRGSTVPRRNPHVFRPNLGPSVPIVMQSRCPVLRCGW